MRLTKVKFSEIKFIVFLFANVMKNCESGMSDVVAVLTIYLLTKKKRKREWFLADGIQKQAQL